jgi:hypothetical protein
MVNEDPAAGNGIREAALSGSRSSITGQPFHFDVLFSFRQGQES